MTDGITDIEKVTDNKKKGLTKAQKILSVTLKLLTGLILLILNKLLFVQ